MLKSEHKDKDYGWVGVEWQEGGGNVPHPNKSTYAGASSCCTSSIASSELCARPMHRANTPESSRKVCGKGDTFDDRERFKENHILTYLLRLNLGLSLVS
jgi:hypothetical protein